jgi:hypothetical protein
MAASALNSALQSSARCVGIVRNPVWRLPQRAPGEIGAERLWCNLKTAVGCARVCRARRVQQGVTTLRPLARKQDQRGWARWAWCHRVHRGVTHTLSGQKAE